MLAGLESARFVAAGFVGREIQDERALYRINACYEVEVAIPWRSRIVQEESIAGLKQTIGAGKSCGENRLRLRDARSLLSRTETCGRSVE